MQPGCRGVCVSRRSIHLQLTAEALSHVAACRGCCACRRLSPLQLPAGGPVLWAAFPKCSCMLEPLANGDFCKRACVAGGVFP